jgi:hypothetical protein
MCNGCRRWRARAPVQEVSGAARVVKFGWPSPAFLFRGNRVLAERPRSGSARRVAIASADHRRGPWRAARPASSQRASVATRAWGAGLEQAQIFASPTDQRPGHLGAHFFSTVSDLGVPVRGGGRGGHPLARWLWRELQRPSESIATLVTALIAATEAAEAPDTATMVRIPRTTY